MLAHGVAAPLTPLLAVELGASASEVGGALTAFGAARLALNLPVGLAVDKFGRKPVIVAGAFANATGCAACASSDLVGSASSLLVARTAAGAGNSMYLGATQVLLNDLADPAQRARTLGLNHAALLMGVSLGPVLGGFAAEYTGSLRMPFALVGVLSTAAAAYAAFALPETRPLIAGGGGSGDGCGNLKVKDNSPPTQSQHWITIVSDRRFTSAGFAHAATFALRQGGRNVLVALAAANLFGYGPMELGQLFGAMALVDLAAVGPSTRLADAIRDVRLLVCPAIALSALAVVVVAAATSAQAAELEVGLRALEAAATAEATEAAAGAGSSAPAALASGSSGLAAFAEGSSRAAGSGVRAALASLGCAPHDLFLAGVGSWSLGTALLGPALPAYAAGLAPPERRGLTIALFRSCGDVGFVAAPLALGAVSDFAGPPVAMLALAASAAAAASWFAIAARPVE